MMKTTLVYVPLLFLGACAVRKLQIPTTAVDMKTGKKIGENSIQLKRVRYATYIRLKMIVFY